MEFRYVFLVIALIQGIQARSVVNEGFRLDFIAGDVIGTEVDKAENTSVLPSSYDECLKLSSTLEDSFNLFWSIITWGFQASQKLGSDIMGISDCGAFSVTCFKNTIEDIKKDLKSIRPNIQKYETDIVSLYRDFRAHLSACF